jgi:hypothetical protein
MANQFSKTGITSLGIIRPWHVTQSIDAFTGIEAYDISLSGSFNMTGSINSVGSTLLSQYDINVAPSSSFISLDDGNLTGTPITLVSYDPSLTSTFSIEPGSIGIKSINSSTTSGSILQVEQDGIRFWDPNYNINPFKVTQVNPALNQWESTFRVNSLTVTGSLLAPDITGSLFGTASYAITASYALNSNIPTSGIVTSVNGVLPSPGGNVSVALSSTITGNSSSLVISSSGANTGSLTPGTLWVISGDGDPNNNGDAYIYTTSSITGEGQWLVISPLDVPAADARYILKNGNDSHTGSLSITGSLNMTGSITGETGVINNLTSSYAISASYSLNSTTSSLALITSGSVILRTCNFTTGITNLNITPNCAISSWIASFTAGRTLTISNLTDGKSIKIYIRNTNASSRQITIQASTTTSGHTNVLCSRGIDTASVTAPTAISIISLAANSGAATIWVANVGGTFVGSIS